MMYTLAGQAPVPEPDVVKWARWFETADRVVAQTEVGGYFVSTVFLGLDHRFVGEGPPILFETMVWSDGESTDCMARSSTWAEAVAVHLEAIKLCRANRLPFQTGV